MPLKFQNLQKITKDNLKDLGEVQKEQIVLAGMLCFGATTTPEEVLAQTYDGDADLWQVTNEAEEVLYDVWVINIDSGVVFKSGTAENSGVGMIQFYFDPMDDDSDEAEKLAEDLQAAFDQARGKASA